MPRQIQFLSTGDITPLAMAMSRTNVNKILGESDGLFNYRNTIIEKWGQYQLQFVNEQLVKVDWILRDDNTSSVLIVETNLKISTTVNEFLDYCDKLDISWMIDSKLSFDRQLAIRTCDSVVVFFDLDHRELQKISRE